MHPQRDHPARAGERTGAVRAHTLAEALVSGHGIERPFLCPDHADTRPSASVNILKQKWYCYVCGARGRADDAVENNLDALIKHLETLEVGPPKVYPESWLNLYDSGGPHPYWQSRFSDEAIAHFRLGYDAVADAATYPLRDRAGRVLGVVQRKMGEHDGPKYKYPWGLDISQYLFNYSPEQRDLILLVEGATDAVAAWEVGYTAFAVYGSQISDAQHLLIDRVEPQMVLSAFDQDEAGEQTHQQLVERLPYRDVRRVSWGAHAKDLCDLYAQERWEAIAATVQQSIELAPCGSDANRTPTTNPLPASYEQQPSGRSLRLARPKRKPSVNAPRLRLRSPRSSSSSS